MRWHSWRSAQPATGSASLGEPQSLRTVGQTWSSLGAWGLSLLSARSFCLGQWTARSWLLRGEQQLPDQHLRSSSLGLGRTHLCSVTGSLPLAPGYQWYPALATDPASFPAESPRECCLLHPWALQPGYLGAGWSGMSWGKSLKEI